MEETVYLSLLKDMQMSFRNTYFLRFERVILVETRGVSFSPGYLVVV